MEAYKPKLISLNQYHIIAIYVFLFGINIWKIYWQKFICPIVFPSINCFRFSNIIYSLFLFPHVASRISRFFNKLRQNLCSSRNEQRDSKKHFGNWISDITHFTRSHTLATQEIYNYSKNRLENRFPVVILTILIFWKFEFFEKPIFGRLFKWLAILQREKTKKAENQLVSILMQSQQVDSVIN